MYSVYKEQYRFLLSRYKRPIETPILLRFVDIYFSEDSVDTFRLNIERVFGKPLVMWSEKVDDVSHLPISMIPEYMSNKKTEAVPHFIYCFFSDWDVRTIMDTNNMMLVFDMIFIGNKDYLFSGSVGNHFTMVRRVFEDSPEYTSRRNHL
jgi:hypothetical protein